MMCNYGRGYLVSNVTASYELAYWQLLGASVCAIGQVIQ
jgi:hypothetical protein